MREVTPETAAAYLREQGRVPEGCRVTVRALGWGVSNLVMRAEVEGQPPIVLKQSRERLRTQAHWVSRLDRIWTERAALELLGGVLPPGVVPAVLWSDEENYLFAMACAPDDSIVWKERLLAGEADPAIAHRAGEILGTMHAETIDHPGLAGRLADTLIFDQLRIDPFYRTIVSVHPDLGPPVGALTTAMPAAPERTFVHGDFSPKNILVHGQGLTLVDFETAHAGDPAFDLGFFLSHLLLKTFRAAPAAEPYLALLESFWHAYRTGTQGRLSLEALERRTCGHAAACALARVDGKSTVDYLDARAQAAVRRFSRAVLLRPLSDWGDLVSLAVQEMRVWPAGNGAGGDA